jgi:hypothetical protein
LPDYLAAVPKSQIPGVQWDVIGIAPGMSLEEVRAVLRRAHPTTTADYRRAVGVDPNGPAGATLLLQTADEKIEVYLFGWRRGCSSWWLARSGGCGASRCRAGALGVAGRAVSRDTGDECGSSPWGGWRSFRTR